MVYGFLGLEAMGGFSHHPRDLETSFVRSVDAVDLALRSWAGSGDAPPTS